MDEDLGIFEFLAQSTQARSRTTGIGLRTFGRERKLLPLRAALSLKLAEQFEELAGRITMNRRAWQAVE